MLQVLRQLVLEMRDGSGSLPAHLKSFVMERCAGAVCLAGLQNSRLDVRYHYFQVLAQDNACITQGFCTAEALLQVYSAHQCSFGWHLQACFCVPNTACSRTQGHFCSCKWLDHCRDAAVSTLLTDMASLLLTCAGSVGGELPNYLKLRVLPHLNITPALQVRLST